VPSIYALVTRPDGSEIQQDLKLRIVPITGLVRFIPTGRHAAVQPYFGVGVAALKWHYAESGEFVDPSDGSIFRAQYIADGTEVRSHRCRRPARPDGRRVHDRRGRCGGRKPRPT
jgi:hypothetical protein